MNRVHGFYMHGGLTRKAKRFASLVNFKVWSRMSGGCRKVNPPVESCLNGKVAILRRHAQTDVHPSNSFFAESLPCGSISWAASPTRVTRAPAFPKKELSASNCNAQQSRNPVSPRTRFPYGIPNTGEPKHLPTAQHRLSREDSFGGFMPYSALSRRFGKERPNNSLHFGSLTLRTLNFFRIVLLHSEDFGSFLTALGTDVFVDGHSFWLVWGFLLVAIKRAKLFS